jgi:hypothetical protein
MSANGTNGNGTLEPRQIRFVEEFVIDWNATQAAIRAGYSKRTARQIASENLSKPDIAHAIQSRLAAMSSRAEINADQILGEIDTLSLSDVGELFDWDAEMLRMRPIREWPEHFRRSVSTLKVKRYPIEDPQLEAADFEALERIATGKGYTFDINRAISPEDQARVLGLARRLKDFAWNQYEVLEIKLWDKNSALTNAAKRRGLLKENVVVSGSLTLKRADELKQARERVRTARLASAKS